MPEDSVEQIRKHWETQAADSKLDQSKVTHIDANQRALENDIIIRNLPPGLKILDVGCGSGFSTAQFSRIAGEIVGIDYIPGMIERAKREYGHIKNAQFRVADLMSLDLPSASFGAVISQRCLINLGSWENQKKAITHIARVLVPGGHYIMQEGTQQGRESLNQMRVQMGLSHMPPVAFNLDFNETLLWPFVRELFDIVHIKRFGVYDFVSRIVHPLLVSPDEPKYDAKINDVAYRLSAEFNGMDELGREFSAVLRRKDSSK